MDRYGREFRKIDVGEGLCMLSVPHGVYLVKLNRVFEARP